MLPSSHRLASIGYANDSIAESVPSAPAPITSDELRSFVLETFGLNAEHGGAEEHNAAELFPPGFTEFAQQLRQHFTASPAFASDLARIQAAANAKPPGVRPLHLLAAAAAAAAAAVAMRRRARRVPPPSLTSLPRLSFALTTAPLRDAPSQLCRSRRRACAFPARAPFRTPPRRCRQRRRAAPRAERGAVELEPNGDFGRQRRDWHCRGASNADGRDNPYAGVVEGSDGRPREPTD